jgi:hypothetical protein
MRKESNTIKMRQDSNTIKIRQDNNCQGWNVTYVQVCSKNLLGTLDVNEKKFV